MPWGQMTEASDPSQLLDVQRLTKKFGALTACDHINLNIKSGEIHALLGENGAGKSTLVKMLFGSLQPLSGEIIWKGQPVHISSPAYARKLGIGMVFQHFSLFDSLTAAENIALSLDAALPLAEVTKKSKQIGDEYGLPIDPHALVGDLSVGERQRIEIIRCLLQEPDLIILDEPTSVLTPQEADKLFVTLNRLKSEGKSILYISHRLEEVKQICDRATVLRHGKVISHCRPSEETAASLARMMVGEDVALVERPKTPALPDNGSRLLEITSLSQPRRGPFSTALRDISLNVAAGEVVGIAGVAGNGQGEFFEAVSGEVRQNSAATIRIRGAEVGLSGISQRRMMGAAFVPEERLGHGAVPELPLTDNLLLSRYCTDAKAFLKGGFLKVISQNALSAATKRINVMMDVRKNADNPVAGALSGGNLQKFIIGRELDRSPAVMVVNQPTWGVDAGAAMRIRQALVDLSRQGSAVLVISQDLDELFEICDRIAVMHHGKLSEPMSREVATAEKIGLMMGGAA